MSEFDKSVSEKIDLLKRQLLKLMPEPTVLKVAACKLTMAHLQHPTSPRCSIYTPLALLILQGKKHSVLGSEEMEYGAGQYMVTNLDIPSTCHVSEASPEKPYLALYVELDSGIIADLLREMLLPKLTGGIHRAMAVAKVETPLLDAFLRLAELAEKAEEEQKIMAPLVLREIHYRLLTGAAGDYIATLNTVGSKDNQILKAVEWIKNNFAEKINVDDLAERFGMTASTFYRNFMKVTTLSPIQYQKQIRLNEAQRLMLAKSFDAQKAAYAVGYESATQFSAEYKRRFGLPPARDIKRLSV